MADQEVRLSTRSLVVAGLDIKFDFKLEGSVVGTLPISAGGARWRQKGQSKTFAAVTAWREFALWAEA